MSDQNPSPKPVPPGKLIAYTMPGADVDIDQHIRPCQPTRDWMDQVPGKFIYRCVPLTAANTQGWEILNPVDAEVVWNGGDGNLDLRVNGTPHQLGPQSHFGSGMVTWYLPFLFRTPEDCGLVVTGPANHEHDDSVPLDAFVRTDWLPFPFTMNWRLTRKNEPVRFKAGEPICRVFPMPLALLNETQLEVRRIEEDPGFLAELGTWHQRRQENAAAAAKAVAEWQQGGAKPTGEGAWNSAYVKATKPGEDGKFEKLQTVFKCAEPVDKR